MRTRISLNIRQAPPRLRLVIDRLEGRPIQIRFLPALTVSRGKLLSNVPYGEPVHAGSQLRKRIIVLDSALRNNQRELVRIAIHELFHFAWLRLGNPSRASYGALLLAEAERGARGELGWSAEWRKQCGPTAGSRAWREYMCESFCDTAAWLYGGLRRHDEFTLSGRWRRRRAQWFAERFTGPISI